MPKKILKKEYSRIEFKLASPLSVGSGKNTITDKDIIKKKNNLPYIPATAIAGVIRNQLTELSETDQVKYFGFVTINRDISNKQSDKNMSEASQVVFYDATIVPDDIDKLYVTKRDLVALDEYKTAVSGSKFDMEILEPGVRLVTYVEQNFYEDTDQSIVRLIEDLWLNKNVSFGSKTMRGYGEITDVKAKTCVFNLTEEDEVEKWLDFDMYDENSWQIYEVRGSGVDIKTARGMITICLGLEQNGGISVRRYTSDVKDTEVQPDYEQLTIHRNTGNPMPVIPGTSWAGAFRHCVRQWLDEEQVNDLFGYVKEKEKHKRISNISFSETQLKGAKEKILSRNSIDRFSGGTVTGALFTEKTYYAGKTDLVIKVKDSVNINQLRALAAAIVDLHMGYMAVGGETSIGRGLFRIENLKVLRGDKSKELSKVDENSLFADIISFLTDEGA